MLGPDDRWVEVMAEHPDLRIAMAVDPPRLKKMLVGHYGSKALATLISPDAYVASSACLGPGCIVQRGAKILPDARLGTACKVNVNSTVHHDVRAGDYCTFAPGSQLLGNVVVSDEVFIGAGAIVLPRVRIGERSTVAAGAVVAADVPPDQTVMGVPARTAIP